MANSMHIHVLLHILVEGRRYKYYYDDIIILGTCQCMYSMYVMYVYYALLVDAPMLTYMLKILL